MVLAWPGLAMQAIINAVLQVESTSKVGCQPAGRVDVSRGRQPGYSMSMIEGE